MFLDRNSLREAISEEIDRNYQTIETTGKQNLSVIIGIISLLGITGFSVIANFFSEWIFTTSLLIFLIYFESIITGTHKTERTNNNKKVSEKQKSLRHLLIYDSAIYYLEAVSRALGTIFAVNIAIVILFIAGRWKSEYNIETILNKTFNITATCNFEILEKNITTFNFSYPSWLLYLLQAITIIIIFCTVIKKKNFLRTSLRFLFAKRYKTLNSIEFKEEDVPILFGIIYVFSVCFFSVSIPISFLANPDFLDKVEIIFAILIIQYLIYGLLSVYFSANIISKECFKKISQLNTALSLIEGSGIFSTLKEKREIEEIYHFSRILMPFIEVDKLFFSHYVIIPNVAYWREECEEIVIKYLKTVC